MTTTTDHETEPTPAATESLEELGTYGSLQEAEHVVDRPSGAGVPAEALRIVGTTLFVHTPDGFGRSELALYLLGRSASPTAAGTARNWSTVTKLLALCDG